LRALRAIKLGFSALVDNGYQQVTRNAPEIGFPQDFLKTPTNSHNLKLSNLTISEVFYAAFSI
jgi:hypothetical protein